MSHHFDKLTLKEEEKKEVPDTKVVQKPEPRMRKVTQEVEPSYMVEFREASSQYVIDHKEDSAEISSNAEFEKADKMQTFEEDDIEVLKIEKSKDWRK